ncbi:hypothetical protein [Massilia sp. YMA4]|uniref:hypothetical protein n=1 Tax=Massilia sp. YMA4 TaxID=1593482 RepID=UPI000DD11ED1|nr:hypothetical protein [Massilia sp. YMA4]AXA92019.1 hypothetical protein DPH57_13195 [Massilia sp. YMA4]
MTPAFAEFTRQYHLTGREKADGYTWTAFAGLAVDEKQIVFDMLVRELPWACDWLFALDPVQALVVAQRLEPEMRGRTNAYWLQQQMVRHSGDLRYQRHMMEDYAVYPSRHKAQLLRSLAATPMNERTIEFLKHVLITEVERDAVFWAGCALMDAFRVPNSTEVERQRHHRILDGFRQSQPAARLAALARLELYEALWQKRQTLVGRIASVIDKHPARQRLGAELAEYAAHLAGQPASMQTAREAWAFRRAIDIRSDAIIPVPLREYVRQCNLERYRDSFGPSFESLMVAAARKTQDACRAVLELSLRPPVWPDRLLSDFGEWLLQEDAAYLDAALQQLEQTDGKQLRGSASIRRRDGAVADRFIERRHESLLGRQRRSRRSCLRHVRARNPGLADAAGRRAGDAGWAVTFAGRNTMPASFWEDLCSCPGLVCTSGARRPAFVWPALQGQAWHWFAPVQQQSGRRGFLVLAATAR